MLGGLVVEPLGGRCRAVPSIVCRIGSRCRVLEITRQIGQNRVASIPIGQHCFTKPQRPANTESWIIPEEAAIMLGGIILIYLIYYLCIELEGAIAVGKPFRYENLVPFAGAHHHCDMVTEAGRTPANVDSHIKDRTRRYPQQLGLRKGWDLEVKPADHPFARRQRMVFLNKIDINSAFPQQTFLEYLRKKSAGIVVTNRREKLYFLELGV